MRPLLFAFLLLSLAIPAHAASVASGLEVSGWLPYWKTASSTADALAHLSVFKEINPFGYSLTNDGLILDTAEIVNGAWDPLITAAHARGIRVIPTIMWGNPAAEHTVLSDTTKRIALEDAIAYLVETKGFDGIDIDFEARYPKTKDYYSTFLKGLYARIGKKLVMCDVEARMPVADRYAGTPPPDAYDYANDYVQINKYCDRVRIMAYDQGRISATLDNAANGAPYAPVSDTRWAASVMKLAAQTISKRKLVLGIPTYGYEYEVTPTAVGTTYKILWPFNSQYARNLLAEYGATATRSASGELSFTYVGSTTPSGSFNYLSWSDGKAIRDKIALAKSLGLRGVALFKIDGGEDPGLWDLLSK